MAIQLLTDSTIDLPEDKKNEFQIITIPINIILNDTIYQDGIDISLSYLHEQMRKGIVPKTSQITPAVFRDYFKKVLDRGDDILYFGFSKELSGTQQVAINVAEELRKEYPERKIEIVDSKGGAYGAGLVLEHLGELNKNGTQMDDLIFEANRQVDKTHYLFTLTNLDWLHKGGRIPKAVSIIGDALEIKPILDLKDGKLEVIKKVRGIKRADRYLLNQLLEGAKNHPDQIFGIAHSNDLERAKKIEREVKKRFPEARTVIIEIGSVLTTHLGIGGIGVFWLDDTYFEN